MILFFTEKDLRLANGAGHCAGQLEMFHNGKWRRVSLTYDVNAGQSFETAALRGMSLVCEQLKCGSAVAAKVIERPKDKEDVKMTCKGSESALQKCDMDPAAQPHFSFHRHVGLVCSGMLINHNRSFTPRSEKMTLKTL